jgi:hypothetical protein
MLEVAKIGTHPIKFGIGLKNSTLKLRIPVKVPLGKLCRNMSEQKVVARRLLPECGIKGVKR